MKVTHAGRQITVNVRADGDGLVSHAGSALLAQVADKTGLTRALNVMVGKPGLRAGSHDRGRVVRDLAVMLADGGDWLADLRSVGDQAALFGKTASPPTAFRVIDRIASTPGLLDALRDAHARARERVWELIGAPERLMAPAMSTRSRISIVLYRLILQGWIKTVVPGSVAAALAWVFAVIVSLLATSGLIADLRRTRAGPFDIA